MKPAMSTAKFTVRIGLLVVIPVLMGQLINVQGQWKILFDAVLPVLLPIIDKWVHEDERIPAKGILPF